MSTLASARVSDSAAALPAVAAKPYHGRRLTMVESLDDIDRALDGDIEAMRGLVARLRPVVHAEIAQLLFRMGSPQGWDPRQECRDLVQEVFVLLLAKRGKVLRSWDPARGSSLDNFVRLVARRHVIGLLRSKKRNPWTEAAMSSEDFEQRVGETELDRRADARARLAEIHTRLEQRLDERGMMLFHMLYVEQRGVDEVCQLSGMTRDAVYAWRSRLKKILAQLHAEMESHDG